MLDPESTGQQLLKGTGRLVGHMAAIVVGLVLMFGGVGMGVTLVMLPIGIPVGLVGLLLFLWGLFGYSQAKGPSNPTSEGK